MNNIATKCKDLTKVLCVGLTLASAVGCVSAGANRGAEPPKYVKFIDPHEQDAQLKVNAYKKQGYVAEETFVQNVQDPQNPKVMIGIREETTAESIESHLDRNKGKYIGGAAAAAILGGTTLGIIGISR